MRRVQRLPAVLVLLVALAGCGPTEQEQLADMHAKFERASRETSLKSSTYYDLVQSCLTQVIDRRVAEVWAESAAKGEFPPSVVALDNARLRTSVADSIKDGSFGKMEEIPEAALEKCVPSYEAGSRYNGSFAQTFADNAYRQAKQKYLDQIGDIQRDRDAKKAVANQAALKREEPALWAGLHTCAFEGAARLALASDEPAETIVAATFALCRPQRTALIELHRLYGDLVFTDEMMDKVETRVAGALVLEVIRARATKAASPSPPLPVPPRPNPDQSI